MYMRIRNIKQSIEEHLQLFKESLKEVNSFSELCKLYDLPSNGKQYRYFKELILKNNFDISYWDRHKKQRKYKKVEKVCPICNRKFITLLHHRGEKYTCSHACANLFFRRNHTEEEKNKIKSGLRKYWNSKGIKPITKIVCIVCGKEKIPKRATQRFCSNKCAVVYRSRNPEYGKKISDGIKKSIKEGRFKGWGIHRKGQQPSYPEKFFMDVLDSRGIKYEYDKKEGKYHIDFALNEKKIALEIDGGQHKEKMLKYRDDKKDKYLIENGWKVHRIPWKSINNDKGKEYIRNEIEKFINVYSS